MGFRINTNVAALNAHRNGVMNNLALNQNLTRLSSGLRINKAADDASGLAIADSLNSQATGLGQAIRNANDGINVAQTADGALQEYTNIINTVRTKAIQAASDGQNADSRMAIQRDINKLLEEADNIAKTTSFNGQKLLDGNFVDKHFQIGAYANETVGISIDSSRTTAIGRFAYDHGNEVTSSALSSGDLKINGVDVGATSADSSNGANTVAHSSDSAWAKAEAINSKTADTGVTAVAKTTIEGASDIAGGTISAGSMYINGVDLGDVTFSANDSTGTLVAAINKISDQTNVVASIADSGKLVLTASDGSNINLTKDASGSAVISTGIMSKLFGGTTSNVVVDSATAATTLTKSEHGFITLESDDAITISGSNDSYAGFASGGQIYALQNSIASADVTTYSAAQLTIKKADHALAQLDRIRSNIGSVQNQLESTVRNISVTQVNVTAARSTIMDVDFAAESASFAKHNILAQSGSYALSQANAVQQNVLRLLQ